jgi:hypothetical protein
MQNKHRKPSFSSAYELASRMESLPGGPPWQAQKLDFQDAPAEDLVLYWRDPVESLRWLEGNPAFCGHVSFTPVEAFTDSHMTNRLYSEAHTGRLWAELQHKVCYQILSHLC